MEIRGHKIEAGANLRGANLQDADLRDADLRHADLRHADLKGADLRHANLQGANLRYANLQGANLQDANLQDANLRWADLQGADLRDADLRYANLRGADLQGAKLSSFGAAPVGYPVYGFKKLSDGTIAKLLIPAEAKRTYSLVGRKCRAEYAIVIEGSGGRGKTYGGVSYKTGETVYPDKYCDDIRVECSHGIHFFLTPEEAEAW